ncbi:hypothetical protein SEA_KASHFLOW_206 [Mycobacterium phage KashFlow]|nr:hypothetical protein SEA_KASHFLOW_206 [Mycobacterium phage KashFlow]
MKIRETIRHGDYYHQRTGEASTYEEFVTFMQTSPYAGTVTRAENKYLVQAWDELGARGQAEFGWSTLEVES